VNYELALLSTIRVELSRAKPIIYFLIGPRQVGKVSGLARFLTRYPKARPLLLGTQGIPLETFFSKNASSWLVK
jgi:hypothetical protein